MPAAQRPAFGSYQDVYASTGLPVNTWTHLAATWDGTTVRIYVNGVQVASKAIGQTILTTNGSLRFGGNSVWGEYFNGKIDEVRVYKRALSQSEIQADLNTALP